MSIRFRSPTDSSIGSTNNIDSFLTFDYGSPYNITTNVDLVLENKVQLEKYKEGNSSSSQVPTEYSPKLYFTYVKSKLKKMHKEELKRRLEKLVSYVEYARESKQLALFEEATKRTIEVVRKQEAFACGIDYFVNEEDVNRFKNSVKDKVIKFKDWSEFPRVAPKKVINKIKYLMENNIFDNYKVLYTDYTKSSQELKSFKKQAIEKDPILFGVFESNPKVLYFIIDWEDEFCDLTFDVFVKEVGSLNSSFELGKAVSIDDKYINSLKEDLKLRKNMLKNTNSSNFKEVSKALGSEKLSSLKNSFKKLFPFFKI